MVVSMWMPHFLRITVLRIAVLVGVQAAHDEPGEDDKAGECQEKTVGHAGQIHKAIADHTVYYIYDTADGDDGTVVGSENKEADQYDHNGDQFANLLTEVKGVAPEDGQKKEDQTKEEQGKAEDVTHGQGDLRGYHSGIWRSRILWLFRGDLLRCFTEDQFVKGYIKYGVKLDQFIQIRCCQIIFPFGNGLT